MYAVAVNCLELEVLTLGGYNEHVTDGGITVLLEACRNLHTVKLSSKLLKVGRRVLVCDMCNVWGWNWRHMMGCRLRVCMLASAADSCPGPICWLPCAGD